MFKPAKDWRWHEVSVSINAHGQDAYPCLCTFRVDQPIDVDDLRSMAALGAAVVCLHHGLVDVDGDYFSVPGGLPDTVRKAIDKYLPEGG
jgi:hypothetical protein